ncbi:MAG: S-adenosylmethionine:tRNA ribosyltransferase-isomerase, partial [Candidatus Schekmanbacteria bacterium]
GSIAAPTAGLHFTNELLQKVEGRGVTIVKITLHVGKGTFIPIKTQNIEEHRMEEEEYFISEKSADILNQALEEEKRIIAVGTTTTRALENEISKNGKFTAGRERADIFIYPGYKFKAINALITNFHLPQSTLLALVSAFCGRERILSAYECAKENGYRFYSYGDAMLII